MAEVLDIAPIAPPRGDGLALLSLRSAAAVPARGTAVVPARGSAGIPVRARAVGVLPRRRARGGMPVIAPVPTEPRPDTMDGIPSPRTSAEGSTVAGTTVDHLTETYRAHYRSLLGLAALLLDDTASCEDVVQEAFIRVHSARKRVREPEKTLAYLRQTVVNLSRSALRRRILGLKLLSKPMPDMASAEEGAYDQLEREDLIKAMKGLQRRQREVLALRYFSDMTEAQVAEALGISLGSVKAYGSRGIAALRVAMGATS
ncbi:MULTISPECIES: SigE family RNA polymerase sigma factor [unclassified Streptomyces]|uniref:SigE family RNA polymerase sigma factor n=1 Tax=unclassified Streptomyces TaxID=2593676 RepID=UPI0016606509|nr:MULTISPECIES: SigE family RNA polymerase sigma factor [unclassified Streptomyces]MBD0712070.1 RNA polymerase subunit sigma-24 [Streptomyces sp. CBMA291]MBD0717945.1 RNA polymerase subunit sigma-24 [Streptomyces sp. CBMA370]